MPSFDYQKNENNNIWKRKRSQCPNVQNVKSESFVPIFYTEINVFVIIQSVKYRKK